MTDCRHRHSFTLKELAMLKHSALLAIAASATVGLTMLAPTDASARNGGGPHLHAGRIVAGNVHPRFQNQRFVHNGRVFYNNRVFFNNRFAYRANFFRYNTRWAWHPGFCWRHPLYCRTQLGVYHYGVAPVYQPAPVIAAPVVAPFGRCLRQIRLADGSSLFRNLCSNEAAITSNLPEEGEPAPLK